MAERGTTIERATRITLRPIGNPLPLGFIALSVATLLLSAAQLGWLSPGERMSIALVLLSFPVPLQLLASVLGFVGRDPVAGTGMGVLSGSWLATALVLLRMPPESMTSATLGIFLLIVAVALLFPAGAAFGKLAATIVIGTTAARFALTGMYELTGVRVWATVAGVVGIVLCLLALYVALAMLLEDVRRRTVLPLLRRGAGRASLNGNLERQLDSLDQEAGVREQL